MVLLLLGKAEGVIGQERHGAHDGGDSPVGPTEPGGAAARPAPSQLLATAPPPSPPRRSPLGLVGGNPVSGCVIITVAFQVVCQVSHVTPSSA